MGTSLTRQRNHKRINLMALLSARQQLGSRKQRKPSLYGGKKEVLLEEQRHRQSLKMGIRRLEDGDGRRDHGYVRFGIAAGMNTCVKIKAAIFSS